MSLLSRIQRTTRTPSVLGGVQRPTREASAETPPTPPVRLRPDDGRDDEQQGEWKATPSQEVDDSECVESASSEVFIDIGRSSPDNAPGYRGLGRGKREENTSSSFNDLLDIVVGVEG